MNLFSLPPADRRATARTRNFVEPCSFQQKKKALKSSKPKILAAAGEKRPTSVFTDASWESGYGGLGAVIIDLATNTSMVQSVPR